MSKCFSGVNLFPLLQKKRTSMKNNTKLKSREIVFVLLHNNLEFSFVSCLNILPTIFFRQFSSNIE